MKAYQDLYIRGESRHLQEFIKELDATLGSGWSRDIVRESEVKQAALGRMFCYACTATLSRPASRLWIATKSDGSLYVGNILAEAHQSLTFDQYNSILADFHDTCALPAARRLGPAVELELSNPNPTIEDFLSPNCVNLLRSFSHIANRAMLHPSDRRRWNEFVAAAYRDDAKLDSSMLRKWLIEEEGWSEAKADDLAEEYGRAKDLLEVFQST